MNTESLSESDIDRLAHKRAAARMGWYVHAVVYLLVNLGLFAIALLGGRNWAVYPLLGWGMGLAIHGAVVLMALPGAGLYQRLLQRERSRLQALRDPW